MLAALNGKKTYIAGGLLFLFGILGYLTGEIPADSAIKTILEALAIVGLRHGIAKGL